MESVVGLNGTFKQNSWTPLSVRIENRGKTTKGALDVIIRSGNEYQNNIEETVYRRTIELPPNSTKKYDFFLFIQTIAHPVRIQLSNDGEILEEESLSLRNRFTEKKIVLVLGDRGNSKYFNETAPVRESEAIEPLFLRPGALPRSWFGYDGVESVMLQGGVLKHLSKTQLHALSQWVQSGGFLLLTGDIDYSFFADEAMKNLIDIKVVGLQRVTQLNALEEFSGAPFVAKDPFLILNTRVPRSLVLLEEGQIPLVVEKSLGSGKILFLAFDFQSSMFQDWQGNLNFWQWLNRFRPPAEPSMLGLPEKEILVALIASLSTRSPEFYLIVAFLVIYAIGSRVFYIRIHSAEDWQKWIFPFVLFLLFFIVGSGSYYHFRQASNAQLSSFTLLTKKAHSAFAYVQQWITVYSFHRHRYQLETPSTMQPIRFLESSFVKIPEKERFLLERKIDRQIIGIPLRRWSHQVLTSKQPLEFPLQGRFWKEQENWTFVLENKTEFDFKNCRIYVLDRLIPIEDLPSQKRKTLRLSQTQILKYEVLQQKTTGKTAKILSSDINLFQHTASFLEDFRQNFEAPLLNSLASNYRSQPDRILLIGWLDEDLGGMAADLSRQSKKHVTLLEWEIPRRDTLADAPSRRNTL